MTKGFLSLFITIIFAISLTACTPEININTGTNNESQQSVIEIPQNDAVDNTQSDKEMAQSGQPQNIEDSIPDKQPESQNNTQSDTAAESNESKPKDNTQNQSQEETQNKKEDKNNNKNPLSNKTESQQTESGSEQNANQKTKDDKITKDEAKKIALNHAGVKETDTYNLKAEYDRDDGVESYEIEFKTKDFEYEYDIAVKTGEILKSKKENNEDIKANKDKTSVTAERKTADEAKAIAFAHAGVTADLVYDLELDLDRDNGKEVYEIEFKSEKIEFAYEIDAKSGEILKSQKEKMTDYTN